MERVTGIGGFFFRARDPATLADWYDRHLGVVPVPADTAAQPWRQEAGPTVLAPFPAGTDYFAGDRAFMLNFRVRDLDAITVRLREAGIAVSHETAMAGIGRFARIHDPEGNPIELWEEASPDVAPKGP